MRLIIPFITLCLLSEIALSDERPNTNTQQSNIETQEIEYQVDDVNLKGYLAFNQA